MEIQTLNILEIRRWFIDSTIKSISNKESNFVKSISESLLNLLGLREKVRSISFKRDSYYFEKEYNIKLLPDDITFSFNEQGLLISKILNNKLGINLETILVDYDIEKRPISLIWNLPYKGELIEVFSIKCKYYETIEIVEITEFSKIKVFEDNLYVFDKNGFIISNSSDLNTQSNSYLSEQKYTRSDEPEKNWYLQYKNDFRLDEPEKNEPFIIKETEFETYDVEIGDDPYTFETEIKKKGISYKFYNDNVYLKVEKKDTSLEIVDNSNNYFCEFDFYKNNKTRLKIKVIEEEKDKIIIEKEITITINKEDNYLPKQEVNITEYTLNDNKDCFKYKWYSQIDPSEYWAYQLVLNDVGLPLSISHESFKLDDGGLYNESIEINPKNEFFFSIKNFVKYNTIIPIICEEFGNAKKRSWDENYFLYDIIGRKKMEVNISNKILESFNIYQYSFLKDTCSIWFEGFNELKDIDFQTNEKIILKYDISSSGLISANVYFNDFFCDETTEVSVSKSLAFKVRLNNRLTFTLFKVFKSTILKNETDEDVKNGFVKKLIEKNFKIEYWNNLEVNHKISKTSSLNPIMNRNIIEVKYLNGQDINEKVTITIYYFPTS
jgi:hypothetical protein